jgi:superfamily II DNA or RNA helicase
LVLLISSDLLCTLFLYRIKYDKSNQYKSQLSINLSTGKGKSYCSICTAAFLGLRAMIITSSLNWLNQWKDYIIEYTDIKPREIFFLTGTPSIFSILKKDISKYKFILASHNTIKSYGDTYGWDKVTELFQYLRIGMKCYDEAHLNFDNMCKIDMYTNTYRTYYVTATPARSDKDENVIFQLYFKNVPAIDLFDEDKDPHTQYIGLKYNSHPTAQELSACKNQYGLDRNKYTNYVAHNQNFYKLLHVLLNLVLGYGGKTLFYIGTTDAIDVVKDWIYTNYPELRNEVGVYTSKVTQNKEAQLEKRIILSTTKSCGAAMDIKGLKTTVVLAEPFKSEVLARQTLGRTRDDDTYYIEVVDTGFYYINKYYYEKKNIFTKYATACTEVVLNDIELARRVNAIIESRKPKLIPIISFATGNIMPIHFINEKIKVIHFIA